MRVIAGSLGGRRFDVPSGHRTHPMSEKVRGGLFNALGDIESLTVLDVFAGSGALSFEAISRGAASVVAVDNDKNAHLALTENIKILGLGNRVKATRANFSSWSDNNQALTFDLVFADPPYDKLQDRLLKKLAIHLTTKSLLVVSWPGGSTQPKIVGLEKVKVQKYGDAQLVFYRKTD